MLFNMKESILFILCLGTFFLKCQSKNDQGWHSVSFRVKNKDVNLNLTKSVHVSPDFKLFLGRRNRIETKNDLKLKNHFIYSDSNYSASFIIKSDKNSNVNTYHGIFHLTNEVYMIEPKISHHERKKRDVLPIEANEELQKTHDVYLIAQGNKMEVEDSIYHKKWIFNETFPDYDENDGIEAKEFSMQSGKYGFSNFTVDHTDTNSKDKDYHKYNSSFVRSIYHIRLIVLVDFSTYYRWWTLSKKKSYAQKKIQAIERVQYFFLHVANGIDMRFSSAKKEDFSIQIHLVGIYVATEASASPWTQSSIVRTFYKEGPQVNAVKSLNIIDFWLKKYSHYFPPFDLGAAFTYETLYTAYVDRRRHVTGVGTIKGICKGWKGSLTQIRSLYATIQTSSHEIGHNLGSFHDGDPRYAKNCSSGSQYVMSSVPSTKSDEIYRNAYVFSQCSVNQFQQYLNHISRTEPECLQDADNLRVADELVQLNILLPGEHYDIHTQCRLSIGKHSYYCGGDQNICRSMTCFDKEENVCMSNSELRAYNGTLCGNKKLCISGDCVHIEKAPNALDYCLYGDFIGDVKEKGLTNCSALIENHPSYCYLNFWKHKCCQSCLKNEDKSDPGCLYGDRNKNCASVKGSNCYDKNRRSDCCRSCKVFKTNKKDCLYGDKGFWCGKITNEKTSMCYSYNKTCCSTCEEFHSGVSDCAYGNRATWCDRITENNAYQCYIDGDMCCETCKKFESKQLGCEYGDRNPSCSINSCGRLETKKKCCKTCNYLENEPNILHHGLYRQDNTTPYSNATSTTISTTTVENTTPTTLSTTTVKIATSTTISTKTVEIDDISDETKQSSSYVEESTISSVTITPTIASRGTKSLAIRIIECKNTRKPPQWCDGLFPGKCYNSQVEKTCCEVCARNRIQLEGCHYGDKVTWCEKQLSRSRSFCDGKVNKDWCCKSCSLLTN